MIIFSFDIQLEKTDDRHAEDLVQQGLLKGILVGKNALTLIPLKGDYESASFCKALVGFIGDNSHVLDVLGMCSAFNLRCLVGLDVDQYASISLELDKDSLSVLSIINCNLHVTVALMRNESRDLE